MNRMGMNLHRIMYVLAIVLMGLGLVAPVGDAGWLANPPAFAFALIACAGAALCCWSRGSASWSGRWSSASVRKRLRGLR